jgi:hypothetical protein
MIGAFASGIIQTVYGAGFGFLIGRAINPHSWLAMGLGIGIGAVIGLAFGCLYGWAVWAGKSYSRDVKGVAIFILDHTWSYLNTFAGTIYLGISLIFGRTLNKAVSVDTCQIDLDKGPAPGVAMTIGNVVGGANGHPDTQPHENVHVWQGRIAGPIYLPFVAANWVLFSILPVWLLYHDQGYAPINSFGRYFYVGVYSHVFHEEIAYAFYGTKPT